MSQSFGPESGGFLQPSPRGFKLEEVRLYLEQGGDANRRTDAGQTLLHIAADNGDVEIVRLLLAQGADINARGFHGYTPLHLAVDSDCDTSVQAGRRVTGLPVTQVLLAAGADESIRDDDGKLARDFAAAYGEPEARLYDALPRAGRNAALG